MIKEAYLVQMIQVHWGLEYCYMTILCKCNSVLILSAGLLGALLNHTSRLEWDILVSKVT